MAILSSGAYHDNDFLLREPSKPARRRAWYGQTDAQKQADGRGAEGRMEPPLILGEALNAVMTDVCCKMETSSTRGSFMRRQQIASVFLHYERELASFL